MATQKNLVSSIIQDYIDQGYQQKAKDSAAEAFDKRLIETQICVICQGHFTYVPFTRGNEYIALGVCYSCDYSIVY